jgi:hypothetical protein
VGLGRFGDAVKALESPGSRALVFDKHPDSPRLVRGHVCDSLIITYENRNAAIYSFKKNSASGPTGIRVEPLKDFLSGPVNEEFCSGLVEFANWFASVLIAESVSYLFNSAFLIPVKKRLGGIRPIAVANI